MYTIARNKLMCLILLCFTLCQSASAQLLTLTPFTLKDESNHVFTEKNLTGHWSLLFFGFTHCMSICPITLTRLNQLYQKLKADKQILPQILFITLDPERDTKNALNNYVHAFNANFKGLTGTPSALHILSRQLGVVALRDEQSNPKNYQINHSGVLYLVNPNGQLAAVFSPPQDWLMIEKTYRGIAHE